MTVEVNVELKGIAPGTTEGGVIDHVMHTVEVEAPVIAIPDKLILRLGTLKLDGHLTASQIELPEGVTLLTEPETTIVTCAKPMEAAEAAAGDGAEPEVIGRKPDDEKEEGEK